MKKINLLVLLFLVCRTTFAQQYFPPIIGNNWDTISPQSLGWCVNRTDSLFNLLSQNKTKAFIILKDGKIVVEKYFGSFTADSAWYWASAGKTITAALVGIAQQQGCLSINDSSSKYLGKGFTSCTPQQEGLIKIKNQLTMTTGLDYLVPDWDCKDSACLKYKADAGTQWFYHNATYLLLQNVIEAATGKTLQQYTNQQLSVKTGMSGLWYDGVFYSKPRAMARFGLMMLNAGIWNNDTIIKDRNYYNEMINTSQNLNQAYGYLWWLNGKSSFKLPGSVQTFNGSVCPQAPADMFSALGKNDQKLYVVPSQNLVIVRMGEAAVDESPVPVVFDTLLWNELNKFMCNNTGLTNLSLKHLNLSVFPNPAKDFINIGGLPNATTELIIYNNIGEAVITEENVLNNCSINVTSLPNGVYYLQAKTNKGTQIVKFVK